MNRLTFGRDDLDPVTKKKTNLIGTASDATCWPTLTFAWDNLIWGAVIVREIEGLLIRVKKKKYVKNRQTPWENLFASDQQNISNRDSHRGKTNVIIMSVSSVKIMRISYVTRTTTWNLPGPSGTRDYIDIVYLSHPSPLLCGG